MGPTCEVLLPSADGGTLDVIDAVLAAGAERIDRTRKGRVWDVWSGGRFIHVSVTALPSSTVTLAAGCNESADYAVLRRLATRIATAVGGMASEPSK